MFKKNTAVTGFTVGLVSATDGSDITTGTPVGYYTLDGGTQTAIGDVTPVHEGNGQWSFDLTAGEMNGDVVGLTFTHTSAITVHFTIKTDTKIVSELQDLTAAQVNTEVDTGISDAALATAANLATVDTVVDGIQTDLSNATDGLGAIKTAVDSRMAEASINTTAGAIDNVTLVATTTTNTDMVAEAPTAAANADAVWDEAKAGHVSAGSFGEEVQAHALSSEISALNDISAADVNAQCDLALTDYDAATGAEVAALNDISVSDILTTQMTEAYAADGTAPTLAQAIFLIQQTIGDFSITGTTISTYKLDGTTAAATYTLDSSTVPTSRTRSS